MSKRIRAMCRHVSQLRRKPPAWFSPVLLAMAAAVPSAMAHPEQESVLVAIEETWGIAAGHDPGTDRQPDDDDDELFEVGYDPARQQAYRQKEGDAEPEYTSDIIADTGMDDWDPVVAQWPCGMRADLECLTVGEWHRIQGKGQQPQQGKVKTENGDSVVGQVKTENGGSVVGGGDASDGGVKRPADDDGQVGGVLKRPAQCLPR